MMLWSSLLMIDVCGRQRLWSQLFVSVKVALKPAVEPFEYKPWLPCKEKKESVIQNKTPSPPRVNVWLYLVQKQQETAGEKASRNSIVNFTKLKCDNTEPSISSISVAPPRSSLSTYRTVTARMIPPTRPPSFHRCFTWSRWTAEQWVLTRRWWTGCSYWRGKRLRWKTNIGRCDWEV